MRNQYYQQLQAERKRREMNNTLDGMELGLNITAVALNRLFGFGDKRLTRLEQEVQRLWDEEFRQRDPLQAAHDLSRAVEQIRGRKL